MFSGLLDAISSGATPRLGSAGSVDRSQHCPELALRNGLPQAPASPMDQKSSLGASGSTQDQTSSDPNGSFCPEAFWLGCNLLGQDLGMPLRVTLEN